MSEAADKMELEHLEELLTGRRAEYEIFGKTPEDAMKDAEIRRKIVHLRGRLGYSHNKQ